MAVRAETERVRRFYEQTAPRYDEYVGYFESLLMGDGRQWVCGQARGEVLEIAIGTGRNLPYYPPDVRLTGVDLTPAMLEIARTRANALGREVDLRVGDAQALDFPDASFDTVVATLMLSAVPDIRRTVAECCRILRPGGRLLVLDFVRSPFRPVRLIQRVFNPLFVRRYAFHLGREPLNQVVAAGFIIDRLERSKWGVIERMMASKPATFS
jgi:ubiquinone/menaquinone biosynthesis C-methylase UbiE